MAHVQTGIHTIQNRILPGQKKLHVVRSRLLGLLFDDVSRDWHPNKVKLHFTKMRNCRARPGVT
jgi:hypothetical protein